MNTAIAPGALLRAFREYLAVHPSLGLSGRSLDEIALELARIALGSDVAEWPKLEVPAKVGGTTFGKGIPASYVIRAAQRLHAYDEAQAKLTPEQRVEEERRRRGLWDFVNGPLDATRAEPPRMRIVNLALTELDRATAKFPTWPTDPLHAVAVLGEEFGELVKALLQFTYERHKTSMEEVRTEAIQTAAMALRLAMSLDVYEFAPCVQHHQAAHDTVEKGPKP